MTQQAYRARLTSVGNPDRGQHTPVSPVEIVTGDSIDQIIGLARRYRDHWDLGSGNWANPMIVNDQDGTDVGFLSYNMRLWTPQDA